MKADVQTEAEIKDPIEEVWKAYARKDLDALMDLWTSDTDLIAVVALGATAEASV